MSRLVLCIVVLTLTATAGAGAQEGAERQKYEQEQKQLLIRIQKASAALPITVARARGVKTILRDDSGELWSAEELQDNQFLKLGPPTDDGIKTIYSVDFRGKSLFARLTNGIEPSLGLYLSPDAKQLAFSGNMYINHERAWGNYIIDLHTGKWFAIPERKPDRVLLNAFAWLADSRHWVRMTGDEPPFHIEVFDYDKPEPVYTWKVTGSPREIWNVFAVRKSPEIVLVGNRGSLGHIDPFQGKSRVEHAKPDFAWGIPSPNGDLYLAVGEDTKPTSPVLAGLAKGIPTDKPQVRITLYTINKRGHLHRFGSFMDDRRRSKIISEQPGYHDAIRWSRDGKRILFRCYGWICSVKAAQ